MTNTALFKYTVRINAYTPQAAVMAAIRDKTAPAHFEDFGKSVFLIACTTICPCKPA